MPFISIVIPAYNNAHLLTACLDSIAAQTFNDWEVVIVNDASTDNTAEIAEQRAKEDARFVPVNKEANGGLHLARRTGTEQATGAYIMYLDADDELAGPLVLAELANELKAEPADILRFGLKVQAEQGTPESAARGFEQWSNAGLEPPSMKEVRRMVFSATGGWKLPWHVTHRLFETGLAKNAFAAMTDKRLERAEDAYEYLVISSMARSERARCDVQGYLYHMGAGVTNANELDATKFSRESSAIWKCATEATGFAGSSTLNDLEDCAYGLKVKLLESMANDLNERVAANDREKATLGFISLVGNDFAAPELWRFVRDKSWSCLVHDAIPEENDELYQIVKDAEESYSKIAAAQERRRCDRIKRDAETYLAEIDDRRERNSADRPIRLFASAHKRVRSFDSSIIDMVQVGSKLACERFWEMLHDDGGANISDLNPYYCELTAQYWAWKNVDAEYVGFCHYRRYFNFSGKRYPENAWGEIMDSFQNEGIQEKYGLTDEAIRNAIEGFDVVTTEFKDLRSFPEGFPTPAEQWYAAPALLDKDPQVMMDILAKQHPDYLEDANEFFNGHRSCFCNMYVMRKSIFDDYCAWLFPLLDEFMAVTDYTNYSQEAMRTPGHLAERLFNIYYLHQMRTDGSWKVKQVQCVHLMDENLVQTAAPVSLESVSTQRMVVPVVFASDDAYVPMLTTTIHSMLANASDDCFYDITVLSSGISAANQQIMRGFLTAGRPATISFIDVRQLLRSYKLTTNNAHIGIETYFRFLIQDLLPHYDKVLYLDSDLIIKGDVSKLMQVELGDNLIAAARDTDYLGNLNLGSERLEYSKDILCMENPYDYFQAGVLVLNTAAMRRDVPSTTWFSLAQDESFIYNDQDILNACCEGRVVFLPAEWNVMHDCDDRVQRIFSHAPKSAFEDFKRARNHEKVIHYAGYQKPWNTIECDRAHAYWAYARETPYYERLIALLAINEKDYIETKKRMEFEAQPVISEGSSIRALVDPLFPIGSRRRDLIRSVALKAKERNLL